MFGQPIDENNPAPTTHHIASDPFPTIATNINTTMVLPKMNSVRPALA